MSIVVESDLRAIFRKAEEQLNASDSSGNPDLVPFYEDILDIYKRSEIDKGEFEQIFINDFDFTKECPWELVQLCMHHFRFDEYKLHLERKLKTAISENDWRAVPVIKYILESYQESWDDITLFYPENS